MERYQEYKDSGIYFIGTMPSHWKQLRAKYLFKQEKRSVRPQDDIITCFRDGQVTLRKNRRIDGFTNSEKEIGYQGIRVNDLVIHNMDAFAGAIGISDADGKSTPVYAVCTPRTNCVNVYYYCYLLRSLARDGLILSLAKGIRERSTDFRFSDFKELVLPIPTTEEQEKIVNYIDRITAQIDKAIDQQQRMIDLLNERKQIIIQHAVTKGLDPNAKMVDSRVEWCDQISASWNVRRLRYLCKIKTGNKDTIMREDEGQYPFFVRSPKVERINSYTFDTEAILMSGDGAGAGRIFHYYKGKFGCHQRVYCFYDFAKEIYPQFLYYQLSEKFKEVFLGQTAKSTVDSVRLLMLKDFQIIFPILAEQRNIVEHIKKTIKPIEKLIVLSEQKINFLRERKQIIINEVVTGKVKVS